MHARTACFLAALSAASCASTPSFQLQAPDDARGFSEATYSGIVQAKALLCTNHEKIFQEDLMAECQVLPVAIKVGLKGENQEKQRARIAPDQMALRLYLQDGTALSAVQPESLKVDEDVRNRIDTERLKADLLATWESAPEGFVFFSFKKLKNVEVDGFTLSHESDGILHVVDLSKSLVGFNVTLEKDTVPIFVGLERGERRGKR